MKKFFYLLIAIMVLVMPADDYGQRRQRAKNKTKTQQTSKTQASKASASKGPQTSAEAKKQQAAAQKEIQLTQEQIRENDAKVSRGLAELGKLDIQIEKTQGKIKELRGQLGKLDKEITGLESNVKKNEAELSKLREEYLKAVKKMRVSRKNQSMLAFIFSSGSMSQALRRMRYLREFSSWRSRQTDEINGKIADLKQEQEALTKARGEQQAALTLQKSSETQLAAQKSRQEVLVAELRQNGKALERHLSQKQAEARELGNKVSQLIAEEQRRAEEEAKRKEEEARRQAEAEAKRKAEEERLLAEEAHKQTEAGDIAGKGASISNKGSKGSSTPKGNTYVKGNGDDKNAYADARKRSPRGDASSKTTKKGSTQSSVKPVENKKAGSENTKSTKDSHYAGTFEAMRGRLPSPSTAGFNITSRFGRQELQDLPGIEYDNPGIDAETDAGASARAVFKGKVSGVYLLPGYNTVVIVNHDNYYTVYGNIASPSVKTGDSVESGSLLGKLAASEDNAGHSSIHFEVWRNREKLNPQDWLR